MLKPFRNITYRLLRRSEQYTQTDMVYLAKGNFWQVLGQVITSVFSLALVIVFANYLPKETYGLYRYILSIAGILSVFTLTGMNQAVSQAVAVGNEGALRESIKYQLKWNLMQFFALVILGAYYFLNDNLQLALSLWIMSVFSPLTAAFGTYGAYLAGKRQFRLTNIFSIISTAVYVAGMITVIFLSGEIVWLIAAYSLTTLGAALYFYFTTLRKFGPPAGDARNVLKYGRELTFIGFLGPIMSQIDKIILTHFWGATQLAVYSLATAVPDKAVSFIKGWVHIGMPKFSAKKPKEINTVFKIRIFQGLIVGAICTLAYIVLSPYLFEYLIPKYIDSLLYSQLLSVSFIFAMPNRYIGLLMASQKLSRLIFTNSMVQGVIRIASYIILGIWGGVLGLVIAQILNSLIAMIINIIMWRSVRN